MSQSAKISKFPTPSDRRTPHQNDETEAEEVPGCSDPTRDIRSLIDQLQVAAREAQVRQQVAERERDELQAQVGGYRDEIAVAGIMEERLKTLVAERDDLAAKHRTAAETVGELQARVDAAEGQVADALRRRDDAARLFKKSQVSIDETMRARDEAVKQRAAVERQRVAAITERDELAAKFADLNGLLAGAQKALVEAKKGGADSAGTTDAAIQQQILLIRQARDNAAAQASEFRARIVALEEDVAAANYEREIAEGVAAKAAAELAELRKSAEEVAAEHERESAQLAVLRTESEMLRKRHEAAVADRDEQAKAAAEMASAVADLKERNASLKKRNESLSEAQCQSAEGVREFSENLARRDEEIGRLRARIDEYQQAIATTRERIIERDSEIEKMQGFAADRDRAVRALEELRQQSEQAIAGRAALEAELAAAREELSLMNGRLDDLPVGVREGVAAAKNHEQTRREMIELAAQLETAQREIRELSASLAEARLLGRAGRAPSGVMPAARSESPADERSLTKVVGTMLGCARRLAQAPGDVGLICELDSHVYGVAEGAVVAGQRATHRIAVALGILLKAVADAPARANDSTAKTIRQAIELLSKMISARDLDKLVKLGKLRAFIVDDEVEAGEKVALALRAAGIHPVTVDNAAAAITELAENRYDLVLLDIFVPGVNGFEICSHVRGMATNGKTPVIFISGDASDENRAEALQRGGCDLIAKPVMAEEVALGALASIVRAQLCIA